MDNTIFFLNEMVKQLIVHIEKYSDNLEYHAVRAPKEILDEALKDGFPEDIYSYYVNAYLTKNETNVANVTAFIKQRFIPYLTNVSFYLQKAMNEGNSSSSYSSVMSESINSNRTSDSLNKMQIAIENNNKEIEQVLGIKQGPRMSIAEADKQNANPHLKDEYIFDPNGDYETITGRRYRRNPDYNPEKKEYYEQFKINCATCATAYALRLRGFDVKAKGNVKGSGSLNEKISNANEYLNVWKNEDGTKVDAIHTDDWMKKNGINEMTTNDYRKYFEESCKEKGVYVVMVRWSDDSSGHATILQRDADGVLYYIEPQRYEMSKGVDGKRSLDDLLIRQDGSQKLASKPMHSYGVLRVDNKIFNTNYASLFEI